MDNIEIVTPVKTDVSKIDIKEMGRQYTLTINATDRLLFAKQVLFFIFAYSLIIVLLAAFFPDNDLIKQMIDLIKIGVLPLITLIISFYFPQNVKDSQSSDN
jgi:hypothetical protein